MERLICAKFVDDYLILPSTGARKGASINDKSFNLLVEMIKKNSKIPAQLKTLLRKIGVDIGIAENMKDIFYPINEPNLGFGYVSYEITEQCNYNCKHCVLGLKRSPDLLSTEDKKNIIKKIKDAGCIYLRITGGEPLIAEDFDEIYLYAHSLGFILTIQTNGSLLSKKKYKELFKEHPPYKIILSMYGATQQSYESLTGVTGSFDKFISSINLLNNLNLSRKVNIIVTKYNENELDKMVRIASSMGFSYFIYEKMTPTFQGNSRPLGLATKNCLVLDSIKTSKVERGNYGISDGRFFNCKAGETFFHVNSSGRASPCQSIRDLNVNLLENHVGILKHLSEKVHYYLERQDFCKNCSFIKDCKTCPPTLNLFQKAGYLPFYICKNYGVQLL